MPDRAVVMSAPDHKTKPAKGTAGGDLKPERALRVQINGVILDAVSIKDAAYRPDQGDDVITIYLSNNTVLLLGPA